MSHVSKVIHKKCSASGKIMLILPKRVYIDRMSQVDPIEAVLVLNETPKSNQKVFGQLSVIFRYGREEQEIMGLHFCKELSLDLVQLYPYNEAKPENPSKVQQKLLEKFGEQAMPFNLRIPSSAPNSVILQLGGDNEKPYGIFYSVKVYFADSNDQDRPIPRDSVEMNIRKMQIIPPVEGRPPTCVVKKDFMMSSGQLELEATLDRLVYHPGGRIAVTVLIRNYSNKTVKRIIASIVQGVDISMVTSGSYRVVVSRIDTDEGCPISPRSTLTKTLFLTLVANIRDNQDLGIAMETPADDMFTQAAGEQLGNKRWTITGGLLASSTLPMDQTPKDGFAILVSYMVRIKLMLGAIGGEVVADLPFVVVPKNRNEPERSQSIEEAK